MKTVGETLKEARLKKNWSLEKVQDLTKIRTKYLRAIEENHFSVIPQTTVTCGFIRNYSLVLGLNPDFAVAILKRDFTEDKRGQIVPREAGSIKQKMKFFWSPKLSAVLFLLTLILGLSFFGFYQYQSFNSSPKILINFPTEGEIVRQKEIEVSGKTDKDATLYLNGEIINLSSTGEFKGKVILIEGENEIVLEALNRRKQKTRIVRKLQFLIDNPG